MATTLQTYLTEVQNLLHDPNGNMWPVAELITYINSGRSKICRDSKCLRQLAAGIPLTAGTELYNVANTVALATSPITTSVIDLMGISVYWGNQRYKLLYMPFTEFDAKMRSWQLYQSRPIAFTRMGALNIYVGPIPDQNYITDWDVTVSPPSLALVTDVETIPEPFQTPVKFWAAYRAKFKEQALGECKIFKDEYMREGMASARAFMTRVIPNPYAT